MFFPYLQIADIANVLSHFSTIFSIRLLTSRFSCDIILVAQKRNLGVAQLVARYLGVVEAASSSLVTQTKNGESKDSPFFFVFLAFSRVFSLFTNPCPGLSGTDFSFLGGENRRKIGLVQNLVHMFPILPHWESRGHAEYMHFFVIIAHFTNLDFRRKAHHGKRHK